MMSFMIQMVTDGAIDGLDGVLDIPVDKVENVDIGPDVLHDDPDGY